MDYGTRAPNPLTGLLIIPGTDLVVVPNSKNLNRDKLALIC